MAGTSWSNACASCGSIVLTGKCFSCHQELGGVAAETEGGTSDIDAAAAGDAGQDTAFAAQEPQSEETAAEEMTGAVSFPLLDWIKYLRANLFCARFVWFSPVIAG